MHHGLKCEKSTRDKEQYDYKAELQKDTKCYSYDFQTDKKSPVHVTKINYVFF